MKAIDKGIPFPDAAREHRKYPWRELEVGDSFLFDTGLTENAAYRSVYYANKAHTPKIFRVRNTTEGRRCWRIK